MKTSEFYFDLPEELIAQEPLKDLPDNVRLPDPPESSLRRKIQRKRRNPGKQDW